MGRMGRGETMRLSILKLAANDLREIHGYLSDVGISPADKLRKDFEVFCAQVATMPFMHAVYSQNPAYRRAVLLYGYLVFYQVDEEESVVKIYRVLHGKRNAMPLLD